jgi:hypothetical protein
MPQDARMMNWELGHSKMPEGIVVIGKGRPGCTSTSLPVMPMQCCLVGGSSPILHISCFQRAALPAPKGDRGTGSENVNLLLDQAVGQVILCDFEKDPSEHRPFQPHRDAPSLRLHVPLPVIDTGSVGRVLIEGLRAFPAAITRCGSRRCAVWVRRSGRAAMACARIHASSGRGLTRVTALTRHQEEESWRRRRSRELEGHLR